MHGNVSVWCDACVYGTARVFGEAEVCGYAWIHGCAEVCGDAWIHGSAEVCGDARVYGNAKVCGDAWDKSPLQIQGTKHFFNVCKKDHIRIGCKEFSFSYWSEHFKAIGKLVNYTEAEITEYGLYIDLAIKLYK